MFLKKSLLFVLFFTCFEILSAQESDSAKILKTFHSISSHDLLKITEELSSEKYKGRLSGSPEYLKAAEWCAAQFKQWGLKPANNGSWLILRAKRGGI